MQKYIWCILIAVFFSPFLFTGCANIIPPSGGPRDTIPPRLVMAIPKDSMLNFNTNKILLTFDEYVDVKDLQKNLIVSPNPKNTPLVENHLKNVTIKLRDTLHANTTYSLNFGNAIRDVNEGNILKNFIYVFSTGNQLDTFSFRGKVVLAETGKIDSTLIVVLHENLNDTAVIKDAPQYYARVNGKGNFVFHFLPPKTFAAFVLPDDYSKRYDDSTKMFAFLDSNIVVGEHTPMVTFYAFETAKKKEKSSKSATPPAAKLSKNKDRNEEHKRLRFSLNLDNGKQDLLTPALQIKFSTPLDSLNTTGVELLDTLFKPIKGYKVELDTSKTICSITYPWKEAEHFILLLQKDAATDTNHTQLAKADTIRFTTKNESDYGSLRIRFNHLDVARHPVLQLLQNNSIVESIPLTSNEIFRKLYRPGDYDLRILYDANQNGIWDTGNFKKHLQPEIVQDLNKKIVLKNNWDNEYELNL
ncbi:MAG: Ig-like domain-containing protein [Bacteroidota bacterium]|nr:Ig-like domain-containing protein [Bacteroidota bacterium]